jgi:hypothetical protein
VRPLSTMARRMLRPMRPNPLMATLTVIPVSFDCRVGRSSPLRDCGF